MICVALLRKHRFLPSDWTSCPYFLQGIIGAGNKVNTQTCHTWFNCWTWLKSKAKTDFKIRGDIDHSDVLRISPVSPTEICNPWLFEVCSQTHTKEQICLMLMCFGKYLLSNPTWFNVVSKTKTHVSSYRKSSACEHSLTCTHGHLQKQTGIKNPAKGWSGAEDR